MKRIFCIAFVCVFLIFSANISAFAETAFSESSYNISYASHKITIKAKSPYPNTRITLIVLNPEKTLSEVESDSSALQYQRDLVSDEEGMIFSSFALNLDGIDLTNDKTFLVYAKVPGYAIEKIADVKYKSETNRFALLDELKKGASEIEAVLGVDENCISLGIKDSDAFINSDKSKLTQMMAGKFNSFTSDEAGFDAACKYIREFCVLELFNRGITDKIFDSEGNYLQKDSLDFSDYDAKNVTTFYECYLNEISDAAKEKVRNGLFGKYIINPEALYKELATLTVLNGITSPKLTGYAHVEKMLTQNNNKLIGLNISIPTDGDTESKISGSGMTFTSVKALEDYVNSLNTGVDNPPVYQTPSIGSVTGNSSSSSIPVKVDETVTKTEEPTVKSLFKDVSESHWASKYIIYLKVNNIASGDENGNFNPEGYVTREQLVKMILEANGEEISKDTDNKFSDVNPGSWYAPYVAAAYKKGYVNGISESSFGVGQYATRQDICVIINRIAGLEESQENKFTDNDMIASYAKGSVSALSSKGIVNGYTDGSFGPENYCTRAEMAAIIYRLAELKNN